MKKYFYGYPAGNYMFKVNNKHKNKVPNMFQVKNKDNTNFKHILHLVLVFLWSTLSR